MGVPLGLPTAAQRASAPKAPIALFAATSEASMPSHSAMTRSAAASPEPSGASAAIEAASALRRSTASPRFTAVGRDVHR